MPPIPVRILVVDDDPDDVLLFERLVREAAPAGLELFAVPGLDEGLAGFGDRPPDVVILDQRLGRRTGLGILRELRGQGYEGAVVMLTGVGGDDVAADALRAGADDFVKKSDLTAELLAHTLERAIRLSRHRHREHARQRRLESGWAELEERREDVARVVRRLEAELDTAGHAARPVLVEALEVCRSMLGALTRAGVLVGRGDPEGAGRAGVS